ncbi:superoxide dismutase [Cu-Zn]-like [Ornithodoros turicata]|uniref:superoxide dismutase [Cu-Zn]-like n=1 Tax=Ornithodoros turicata TaxID=34597 RepID=UPI00313A17B4
MAAAWLLVGLTTALLFVTTAFCAEGKEEVITRAVASLTVGTARGVVTFSMDENCGEILVSGNVTGLQPGKHGFHIHMYGDISEGCSGAGSHFNPTKQNHGAPEDTERHVGDLGNVVADSCGSASFKFYDRLLQFTGTNSIIGRAVVVHENEDDLGRTGHPESSKTGNAGGRVACGIIAIAAP